MRPINWHFSTADRIKFPRGSGRKRMRNVYCRLEMRAVSREERVGGLRNAIKFLTRNITHFSHRSVLTRQHFTSAMNSYSSSFSGWVEKFFFSGEREMPTWPHQVEKFEGFNFLFIQFKIRSKEMLTGQLIRLLWVDYSLRIQLLGHEFRWMKIPERFGESDFACILRKWSSTVIWCHEKPLIRMISFLSVSTSELFKNSEEFCCVKPVFVAVALLSIFLKVAVAVAVAKY